MGIGERPPLLNVLPLPATLGTPITEPTAIVSVDLIITTLQPVSSSHSDHFLSKKKKFVLFSCFSRCRLYLIDSAMGTCPVFSYVNATFLSCPIDCASLSPKVRRIEKKTNKRKQKGGDGRWHAQSTQKQPTGRLMTHFRRVPLQWFILIKDKPSGWKLSICSLRRMSTSHSLATCRRLTAKRGEMFNGRDGYALQ